MSGFFDDMLRKRSCAWQNFAVFFSNFFLFSLTPPIRSLRKLSSGTTIWSWARSNCQNINKTSVISRFNHSNIYLTIISRSFSILAINLLNCLRLSTITCSSSVCVEPMHSKLKSARLFDKVRCARDRSENKKKKPKLVKTNCLNGNQLRLPIHYSIICNEKDMIVGYKRVLCISAGRRCRTSALHAPCTHVSQIFTLANVIVVIIVDIVNMCRLFIYFIYTLTSLMYWFINYLCKYTNWS